MDACTNSVGFSTVDADEMRWRADRPEFETLKRRSTGFTYVNMLRLSFQISKPEDYLTTF